LFSSFAVADISEVTLGADYTGRCPLLFMLLDYFLGLF